MTTPHDHWQHIWWRDDSPHPLGRSVNHDPRSLEYPAELATRLVTTFHPRVIPVLDQGQLGSCTGNATVGLLGTEPFYTAIVTEFAEQGKTAPTLDEPLAVQIYSAATGRDPWEGTYPPDDTGSSGLAAMWAAKQLGLIKSYRHAFGLDMALLALVRRPVIIGINWYEKMFYPGAGGMLEIGGYIAGGHEVVLDSVDVENRTVGGCNSWGSSWGANGRFRMSWDTFGRLLDEEGDVMTAGVIY